MHKPNIEAAILSFYSYEELGVELMKKKSAECVKLRVNEKGTKHNAI